MTVRINEALAAGEAAVRGQEREVLAAWSGSWRAAASCGVWDHRQMWRATTIFRATLRLESGGRSR
ncbi:MAG: hypothetical protein NVS3B1_16200 [Marmoricola sp.]